MSNIATTIEQSKHLLKLGLDRKSADMFYPIDGSSFPEVCDNGDNMQADNPAWSLSALLEVMPKNAELIKMENDAHELYYEIDYMYTGYEDKDAVTAAYEMVCYLLEQGLIEKGGEDENN